MNPTDRPDPAASPAALPGSLALAQQRLEALFTRDAAGDLLAINELDPEPAGPAPRVYCGLTAAGAVFACRADTPPALRHAVAQLCATPPGDLANPQPFLAALRDLLARHGEGDTAPEVAYGPAYVFPETPVIPADATLISPGDEALLAPEFPYLATWLREHWPCYAVVQDGRAVAVCNSSRRTAHVAEAGVDTIAVARGRGYAPRVVAAWAGALRAAGITPVYSTSHNNLASQAVARKLGLRHVGWDVSVE
ncbi:MAG: GNAT family N-acetyltransferase [Thermomicrobiales bacterium]